MTNDTLTSKDVRERSTNAIPTDFMTVPEVAQLLGVHRTVLYDWLSRRVIAFHRVGRLIRVREADVAAYVERNRVDARPAPQDGSRP